MELKSQIGYQSNKIVTRDLIKNDNGRATMLAFDANTELTAHKAPGDAMVQVVEGSIDFVIDGKRHHIQTGGFALCRWAPSMRSMPRSRPRSCSR